MSNQYFGDDRIVHEPLDVPKASSRRIYSNSEVSDDIVTRLRDYVCLGGYECLCDSCALHVEAADEIERLREQNEHLRANVEMLLAEARAVRGE